MAPKFEGNQASLAGRKNKQVLIREDKPFPPWTELPHDITANILQRLGAIEILENAQKVCTTWRRVCKDPAMWRVIMLNPDVAHFYRLYDLVKMCRQAVDRSQGQLVDINLEHFADVKLLDYIAGRSGMLRRLCLKRCFSISNEGLIKAIKGFPVLEELHIALTPFNDETIATVGLSCPALC